MSGQTSFFLAGPGSLAALGGVFFPSLEGETWDFVTGASDCVHCFPAKFNILYRHMHSRGSSKKTKQNKGKYHVAHIWFPSSGVHPCEHLRNWDTWGWLKLKLQTKSVTVRKSDEWRRTAHMVVVSSRMVLKLALSFIIKQRREKTLQTASHFMLCQICCCSTCGWKCYLDLVMRLSVHRTVKRIDGVNKSR